MAPASDTDALSACSAPTAPTPAAYVREAVARYDDYKARAPQVLEASRSAAKQARRPKPGG